MNDPILASDRAIARGLAHFLTPPDDDFYCEVCRSEDCTAPECSLCGKTHECEYIDCGEQDAPADWTDAEKGRAEELHLEEALDDVREDR